jgi:hypothetical protein
MKQLIILLVISILFTACQDEPEPEEAASLRLKFAHLVDDAPLQLNTARYTNAAGQEYNISKFRYYISNIRLRNTRSGEVYVEPESYHLVGTESATTFEITLPAIPPGNYNQLEFAIGVDNSTNTSTDRLGALDPSNDMAWDWNTGYKFILLEGNYFPAGAESEPLVYHIGGDQNYRILTYSLGQSDLEALELQVGGQSSVNFEVNIAELFRTPNLVSFAEHPVVMFDPFSQKVADNYASNMFTIQQIE